MRSRIFVNPVQASLRPRLNRAGAAAPPETAPDSPPIGTRFSTGEDLYLLDGPTSAPGGSVTVTPGVDDLQTVTNAQPAGTTFYLLAGKHTYPLSSEFNQVVAKAGNTYIGAPGAVVDGQRFHRYAFSGSATNVTFRYLEICNFNGPFDEFATNHETASNWTFEYCNFHSNRLAAVGLGSGNILRYSWLHDNQQYAFSCFHSIVNDALTNAVTDVLIDHCEINGNGDTADEFNPDGNPTYYGRNGSCKFWDTFRMAVTNNWVHHNLMGIWADTNDVELLLRGNLITDHWAEGFFYEISYNFQVEYNTFRRNCIGFGLRSNESSDNFVRPAIYISDAGAEPRLTSSLYNTQCEIRYNVFENNWDEIGLWEAPNRFCNSQANTSFKIWKPLGGAATLATCNEPATKNLTVTLTSGLKTFTVTSGSFVWNDEGRPCTGTGIPVGCTIQEPLGANGYVGGFVDSANGILSQAATSSGSVVITLAAGSINVDPAYYDCRWHTQGIKIYGNTFKHNEAEMLGPNNTLNSGVTTGKQSLFSLVGVASPPWSPYTGFIVQDEVTFDQENVWSGNTYRGNYGSHFQPYDPSFQKTWTEWRSAPYNQDAGSSLDTNPPTGLGGGTYYKPAPPTSVSAVAGNGEARVFFTPPADQGGDDILGYTVTSSPGGITALSRTGPVTITGLTNGVGYTFTVQTRNTIGLSVASSASGSVTPNSGASLPATTIPWQAYKPTARKRTSTTAEVSFCPPFSDGGATITNYTATSSPGGLNGSGALGPITVTGLTPGQQYTFTVTATNSVGTGPASPATLPVTPL